MTTPITTTVEAGRTVIAKTDTMLIVLITTKGGPLNTHKQQTTQHKKHSNNMIETIMPPTLFPVSDSSSTSFIGHSVSI